MDNAEEIMTIVMQETMNLLTILHDVLHIFKTGRRAEREGIAEENRVVSLADIATMLRQIVKLAFDIQENVQARFEYREAV